MYEDKEVCLCIEDQTAEWPDTKYTGVWVVWGQLWFKRMIYCLYFKFDMLLPSSGQCMLHQASCGTTASTQDVWWNGSPLGPSLTAAWSCGTPAQPPGWRAGGPALQLSLALVEAALLFCSPLGGYLCFLLMLMSASPLHRQFPANTSSTEFHLQCMRQS